MDNWYKLWQGVSKWTHRVKTLGRPIVRDNHVVVDVIHLCLVARFAVLHIRDERIPVPGVDRSYPRRYPQMNDQT